MELFSAKLLFALFERYDNSDSRLYNHGSVYSCVFHVLVPKHPARAHLAGGTDLEVLRGGGLVSHWLAGPLRHAVPNTEAEHQSRRTGGWLRAVGRSSASAALVLQGALPCLQAQDLAKGAFGEVLG